MVKKLVATLGISAVAISINAIEASAMETGTITTSALNIRSGPSTSNSIIDKAYKGQNIEILESSNGWYKVKLSNGKIGWASGQYISKASNSGSTDTSVQGKKGKIVASPRLNIRSGSGTNYSIVGKANNGEIVEILERSSNGWFKIKMSNGIVGWGSTSYIVETNQSSNDSNENTQKPSTSTPIQGKRGKIKANPKLNIRSGAGTTYSVIGSANNGDIVDLLEKSSNGWYKIKSQNGTIGWGSGDYIEETTESSNNNNNNNNTPQPPSSIDKNAVVNLAYELMGKPYKWGAEGPDSFDCSGFTQYVYKQSGGKSIPRVSRDQARYGTAVSRENYAPGDLVSFDTDGNGEVNHVGIYVGNNQFIHCSGTPSKPEKVKIDNLGSSYWSKVLKGVRRF
ncbi:C40 family peptidase [[Clostridium] dakarense]|uniref:C40 family peptidase n=1 Tax=Faecalimicrobium dakarense TaxID=1301100 RepID=UPI0004B3F0CF|nr:C40 family peptidase [[Clostridium] dakarense]